MGADSLLMSATIWLVATKFEKPTLITGGIGIGENSRDRVLARLAAVIMKDSRPAASRGAGY
jgi:hypothetical protein